jgi:hypothetical protein
MKIKTLFLFFLTIATLHSAGIFAQGSDRISAKSVVKITTKFKGPDEKGQIVTKAGNGTGWCWNNSKQVVTALHVVAGIPVKDIKVYTDKESKSSGVVKIVKVLKEADLALLELDTDLGLTPLTLAEVDQNSTSEFYVWGFPHGIFQMAGDDIRFSRSLDASPTLNSIINKTGAKDEFEVQEYPLPTAKILRVSSTIQPGHSGAPIIDKSGKVIGVADGGLRSGTARLNWAFPANMYVPRLLNSNDPAPTTTSLQSNLYSSYTVIPDNVSQEEQNQIVEKEASENIVGNDSQSISKTWTASYDEILETMYEEDRNEIMVISAQNGINMDDTWYDIYEDFNTGATITIPYGENMVYDNGWFYVNNESNTLHYSSLIFNAGDYENAKNSAYQVFNDILNSKIYVESPDLWVVSPDVPDEDPVVDDEAEYASYFLTRYSNDEKNLMLLYNAEIEGTNLLVVMMVCDLNKLQEDNYKKQFLHYTVALNLAAFAGY